MTEAGAPIVITPGGLDATILYRIWRSSGPLVCDPAWRPRVEQSAEAVAGIVASGETVYGINTGFGKLAATRIADDQLAELQTRLILSHAAGTGPNLADRTLRLVMALKIGALAQGFSGIRWLVIEALEALIAHRVYPLVPAKGSCGASGDLAPLAHIAAALTGVGAVRIDGREMPASAGLEKAGIAPLAFGPKEGLAFINGTQVSTALALEGLFGAGDVFAAAVVAGAMSTDAAMGSDIPFDGRIQALKPHPGQTDVAARYRTLLKGSAIRRSHRDCGRVQDPYSLRCQPQVMGACLDHMRFAAQTLVIEANAVSDNPLIFAADGEVLSGGNFHAEPVAMAADVLALAIAETGALSERRIALLVDPVTSTLPPFLVRESGLNSGFMIAQVTAAALASENKSLAHPASVDSLPTSANQEDHVSMATFAARRLGEMAGNTAAIVAIELLAAAQGIDLRAPLETSPALAEVHRGIRALAPFYDHDRLFAPDIALLRAEVEGGHFRRHCPDLLP